MWVMPIRARDAGRYCRVVVSRVGPAEGERASRSISLSRLRAGNAVYTAFKAAGRRANVLITGFVHLREARQPN